MAQIRIYIARHLCTAPRPQKEAEALGAAGHDVSVHGVVFDPILAARDREIAAGRKWRWEPVADFTDRRPALLPRALASLRAQTFTDWVCELHNDDPADPAPGRLLAEQGDPRITLVTHERNLGGTETFNLFFRGTTEPFYSLLEDDNWWEPDFLATMLAVADRHPTVTVFWANMRVAQELADGRFIDTGRTLWPETQDEAVRLFNWGALQQIGGAVHSNGAALFRSQRGRSFQVPRVPFAVIEPFRERLFPHPLLLVTQPLATFSQTLQTARSRDASEWAECQAMIAATFLKTCPWDDTQLAQVWQQARAQHPPGTTNLILAALADPACCRLLRFARRADWWIVLRGLVRRPGLFFRLRRSRERHADWWQFLEKHTALRWQEATATR